MFPRLFIALGFILSAHVSLSQTSLLEVRKNFSVALRGKALPVFFIEDIYGLTATIGTEFTFFKRHSIGAEVTWFRWRFEEDDMQEHALYSMFERRKYLYFDYKFTAVNVYGADLYLNLYDKIGRFDSWYKPKNPDGMTADQLLLMDDTKAGSFNELGFGIGGRILFDSSRFGIDCSANAKRVSTIMDYYYPELLAANVNHSTWGFYMRLNLFVLLY